MIISVVIPHYNASDLLATTVERMRMAADVEHVPVELIVSDDGSSEQHRSALLRLQDTGLKIVFSERNLGRSGAVNRGVAVAASELILIVDGDCHPGSDKFFSSHLSAISGADVSLGGLLKFKNDFWGRYQDIADARRVRQFKAGIPFSFTTQNMMVRKKAFQSVGGFDESYQKYGFEDRDLLIRLLESGARFAYSPSSAVVHCDSRISLTSTAKKMREAGRYTAKIFRGQHPVAYQVLGYSRLDANIHPALKFIGRPGRIVAGWLATSIDPLLNMVPFRAGFFMARAVTALAFISGTSESTLK